jgi:hypothetical protein
MVNYYYLCLIKYLKRMKSLVNISNLRKLKIIFYYLIQKKHAIKGNLPMLESILIIVFHSILFHQIYQIKQIY